MLEVGNVLSHYGQQDHVVLDKYEQAAGVLNRDVLELDGLGPFDLIVAISTLEHVGWDERPREPAKALRAVRALTAKLAPGGRLVFTVPIGYNPSFDAALRSGELELSHTAALRRIGSGTSWREVAPAEVWSASYDFLLYRANGVLLAFIRAVSWAAASGAPTGRRRSSSRPPRRAAGRRRPRSSEPRSAWCCTRSCSRPGRAAR